MLSATKKGMVVIPSKSNLCFGFQHSSPKESNVSKGDQPLEKKFWLIPMDSIVAPMQPILYHYQRRNPRPPPKTLPRPPPHGSPPRPAPKTGPQKGLPTNGYPPELVLYLPSI